MKKLIRQHFRNLLALLIRAERWKREPKNQEIVFRMEMYKNMRKLILFLVVISMVGCKTKTILVENVRNTRDSTENVELKQRITVSEKALYDARIELKINEQKASELIERLNVSETEKQLLS